MPQSASLVHRSGDTRNSNLANTTIASNVGFSSPGETFGALVRDQMFGSSIAIAIASVGSPVEVSASLLRDIVLAAQPDQTPEISSLAGQIEPVQAMGAETAAFAGFGDRCNENGTMPERSGGLGRALRNLEDFMHDNWDADGARGITPEVVGEAARLLNLLPGGTPEPQVAPASDGSVCMEWESPAGTLWLDIEADRTARMLIMFGPMKREMLFRVDDPKLATHLRLAAARLYPDKRGMAIRTIMVMA